MITDDEFNVIMSNITLFWNRGDFGMAYAQADEVLNSGTPEMKAQCLLLRGMVKEDQGLIVEARNDWEHAIRYAAKKTYPFYCLQHQIGSSYEQEGAIDNAIVWYRDALQTCAEGLEFSGQSVLTSFLRVNGGTIPDQDRNTVIQVIKKSRRVHEFPEEPDLDNLPEAIVKLSEEFAALVERTMNESE